MSGARTALAVVAVMLAASEARADDAPVDQRVWIHGELDPLTFATRGYGGQVGVRHRALGGVRLAVASFALHVPGAIAQIGDNDGFGVRVRPSGAVYALYYPRAPGRGGLAIGASLRLLRMRYEHDDAPGQRADAIQLSPEAIIGYQWHPFHNGFYLQPWLALGVTVWQTGSDVVADRAYKALPVQPFFTVNLGWEHAL